MFVLCEHFHGGLFRSKHFTDRNPALQQQQLIFNCYTENVRGFVTIPILSPCVFAPKFRVPRFPKIWREWQTSIAADHWSRAGLESRVWKYITQRLEKASPEKIQRTREYHLRFFNITKISHKPRTQSVVRFGKQNNVNVIRAKHILFLLEIGWFSVYTPKNATATSINQYWLHDFIRIWRTMMFPSGL